MRHRLRGGVTRRDVVAGGVALAFAPATASFARQDSSSRDAARDVESVEVSARRIEQFERGSSKKNFGPLSFRGGLVLRSESRDFGGFSGLIVDREAREFMAVSDEGHWLHGRFAYQGGVLSGIEGGRMGPILAKSGKVLGKKREKDCEAIALSEGTMQRGVVLLAFERLHRIGRFPVEGGVIGVPTAYLPMPPEARQMRGNGGLEAMTVFAGGPNRGRVVAFSERLGPEGSPHTGWIWVDGQPRRFGMSDVAGFEITDCASLDDGTLIVLERRFRWTEGVKMQLRRVRAAEVKPGALIEGEVLFSGAMQYEIDNMEALAVSRDASGATVLTMMSDNNFNSFLQRTILLQFTLAEA